MLHTFFLDTPFDEPKQATLEWTVLHFWCTPFDMDEYIVRVSEEGRRRLRRLYSQYSFIAHEQLPGLFSLSAIHECRLFGD